MNPQPEIEVTPRGNDPLLDRIRDAAGDPSEVAWAAGLFEGEGSAGRAGGHPVLSLKMVEETSVRRFGEAVGLGKVYGPYGPYRTSLGTRPFFMWVAKGETSVRLVAGLLVPFLSRWTIDRIEGALAP